MTFFVEIAWTKINVKDLKGVEFLNLNSKCRSFLPGTEPDTYASQSVYPSKKKFVSVVNSESDLD